MGRTYSLRISLTWLSHSPAILSSNIQLCSAFFLVRPYPVRPKTGGLGSFPFARRYSGNRCFFLFLRLLRCFSSPGSLLADYFIHLQLIRLPRTGFPHSDIHGSGLVCSSPWLFAAYRVLLRRLVPRHSPYALYSLIFISARFPWRLVSLGLTRILFFNCNTNAFASLLHFTFSRVFFLSSFQ